MKTLKDLTWDEKEYGVFPKKWLEELKKMESLEEQEKYFFKALEDRKTDIKNQIECLEDDLLMFKAFGIKYKNEFEKVYKEQQEQLEKFYEEVTMPDHLYQKTKEISKEVGNIKNTIKDINNSIQYLEIGRLERAIDTVERFNRMSSEEKEIIEQFILKERKIEEGSRC